MFRRGQKCSRLFWREGWRGSGESAGDGAPDKKGYTKGIPRVYKNSRYIGYITRGISTSKRRKNIEHISHPTGILGMGTEC